MPTTGPSHGTARKRFDFLYHDIDSMPLRANDSTAFVDLLLGGNYQITLGGAFTGNGSLDLGDNGILGADLLAFEALVKLDSIDVNADIRIGVAGAQNADPDVIAQSAWFKIKGASGTDVHTVSIETDDATLNIDDEPTAKTLVIGEWSRFRIDFATGIQSVSSPGVSKGGLGSVQFSMSRTSASKHFMDKVSPTKHMDMAALGATIALQPMVHGVQATAVGTTVLQIRELIMEYRTH